MTYKQTPPPHASGTVVSVRGSVVDVRFDTHLPPIYSVLRGARLSRKDFELLLPGFRFRGESRRKLKDFAPRSPMQLRSEFLSNL